MKEEFHAKILEDHKKKLIKIIIENADNDITKKGIFYFDLTRKLVLRPPLPLKCYTCQRELQICGDSNFCRVCDFKGVENVDYEMVEHIKSESGQRVAELEGQLRQSRYDSVELRIKFLDKIVLEAEQKAEIKKLESRLKENVTETEYTSELEAARAAEREALIKAARATEQLQAAEASLREIGSMLRTILPRTYTDLDDVILKKRRMPECEEEAEKV